MTIEVASDLTELLLPGVDNIFNSSTKATAAYADKKDIPAVTALVVTAPHFRQQFALSPLQYRKSVLGERNQE